MLSVTEVIAVGDRWMNEYVPVVEILRGESGNFQRKTCYSAPWSTKILTWWTGTKSGPPYWEAGDSLSHGMVSK